MAASIAALHLSSAATAAPCRPAARRPLVPAPAARAGARSVAAATASSSSSSSSSSGRYQQPLSNQERKAKRAESQRLGKQVRRHPAKAPRFCFSATQMRCLLQVAGRTQHSLPRPPCHQPAPRLSAACAEQLPWAGPAATPHPAGVPTRCACACALASWPPAAAVHGQPGTEGAHPRLHRGLPPGARSQRASEGGQPAVGGVGNRGAACALRLHPAHPACIAHPRLPPPAARPATHVWAIACRRLQLLSLGACRARFGEAWSRRRRLPPGAPARRSRWARATRGRRKLWRRSAQQATACSCTK